MLRKLFAKRFFSLAFCTIAIMFFGVIQAQADSSTDYSTDFSNGVGDWTANLGTWAVEDGEYSQSSVSYYNASSVITERTFADCIIEADLKLLQTDGAWGGINFRKANADDGNASGYLLRQFTYTCSTILPMVPCKWEKWPEDVVCRYTNI